MQKQRSTVLGIIIFGLALLLGAFAAFILPFLVPGSNVPVYSSAWAGGADNRAATLGLAAISVGVLLITALYGWDRRREKDSLDAFKAEKNVIAERLSPLLFFVGSALVALWTLFWGFAILRSGLRVGETNYFLEQTRNAAGLGLKAPMVLYRDLEFPYGPLLLEPAVWLQYLLGHVGISVGACYVVMLTLLNVLGVALIWYVLNGLALRGWARRLLFGICCFEALHPLFGPNYSLGKFALPLAVLVWAAGIRPSLARAFAFAAGLFLSIMVSPELGVGLSGGIVAFSLSGWFCAAPGQRSGWLLSLLAPVAGYGTFLLLYGTAFLDRLRHASGGALNLIIQPMPDILVFCFAIVWLAPVAVGLHFRQRRDGLSRTVAEEASWRRIAQGPLLLGIYVLALGLLPGALGRADPLHVFFNGLPFLILSLVAISRLSRPMSLLWAAALVVLALQVQAANFEMYARSLGEVLRAQRHRPATTIDVDLLAQATDGAPVATPVINAISMRDELVLRQHHMLVADRTPGLAETWDAASEREHITRLRESEWALVPDGDYLLAERLNPIRDPIPPGQDSLLKHILRTSGHALLGFSYPERHVPFSVGALTMQELAANWVVTDRFGSLKLYRKVR